MLRNLFLVGLSVVAMGGCSKEQPAPPPLPVEVAAPAPAPVQPGMEAENPAEREGQP